MIHEEICTYEVCMLAKEKGFDVPTAKNYRHENGATCNAPTQSLLQRWLREEKALHIQITVWEEGWYYEIWVFEYYEEEKEYSVKMLHQSLEYSTYELALEDALKYALEILI